MRLVIDIPRSHPDYLRRWRNANRKRLLHTNAKFRAKRDNLPFDIELNDLPEIPDRCSVLDIPLKVHEGISGWHDDSPTLDRIINDKGYVKDNIRIISNRANRLKMDATVEELEKILEDARSIRLRS